MKTITELIEELERVADRECAVGGDHDCPPGIWQCPVCIARRYLNEIGESLDEAKT